MHGWKAQADSTGSVDNMKRYQKTAALAVLLDTVARLGTDKDGFPNWRYPVQSREMLIDVVLARTVHDRREAVGKLESMLAEILEGKEHAETS
jgi:hypothetical protein